MSALCTDFGPEARRYTESGNTYQPDICIFTDLCNPVPGWNLIQTMNNITTQQLLEALQWRYATKVFDATRKIPADVWQALEHSLVLTPTSYGLQPYRFLVINNPAKRAELLRIRGTRNRSWTPPILSCSPPAPR